MKHASVKYPTACPACEFIMENWRITHHETLAIIHFISLAIEADQDQGDANGT